MKIFTLLFSLILASYSMAEQCSGNVCSDVYINKLVITPASNLINVGTTGIEESLTCNAVTNLYLPLKFDDPTGAAAYSALLAAQMADKKVNIILTGSSDCVIAYVSIPKQ